MENSEIDLIDLHSAFKKSSIYRLLNNAFQLIIGNKIWFVLFIIIGSIGGYFYKRSKPAVFKSEIIINSKEIDNYVSENIIESLNSLIIEQNIDELQKNEIPKKIFEEIKSFELIPSGIEVNNIKINTFKVELYIYNHSNLKQVEKVLINYLNHNRYSVQLKKEASAELKKTKKELLSEVADLEKMQEHQTPNVIDPSGIIREKTNAKIKLIKIESQLLNMNNYTVLNSFTPTTTPEPTNGKYPLKCALLSFILGFIILRIFKR